ncbi:MAG TPA: hypothetical protein VGM82_00165 [Gemmatimonadaceae bacterium]|jgi:hypothetical protein
MMRKSRGIRFCAIEKPTAPREAHHASQQDGLTGAVSPFQRDARSIESRVDEPARDVSAIEISERVDDGVELLLAYCLRSIERHCGDGTL